MSSGAVALKRQIAPPEVGVTDDELMARAVAGEREAYEALVRRHQAQVRAYCGRWVASSTVGDDLAQECFVEVWRRRQSYVARGKFKAYLFHIAANRCKNHVRGRRRERVLHEAQPEPETEPASQRLLKAERQQRVQASVDKLPEAQRQAVLLRYSAELDYAEIASLLAVPEATARSRVFTGLVKLRRLLRMEKA